MTDRVQGEMPVKAGRGWLGAAACIALATLVTAPVQHVLGLTNTVMLLLLAAVLAAYRYGPGPGLLAALLSVASFDFFYVPPRGSFSIHDRDYAVTFAVMLVVALMVGQLTARLRAQAAAARDGEQRMRVLYEMARELSSALTLEHTVAVSKRFVSQLFAVQPLVLLPIDDVLAPAFDDAAAAFDSTLAAWSFEHQRMAGRGTDMRGDAAALYVPLTAPMRARGVLVLVPCEPAWQVHAAQQRLLDALAALIAIALERIHFISVAQDTQVAMASERLRNALLSALSHDLKTPLTVMVGMADALHLVGPPLAPAQADIVASIRDEAMRTSTMVTNLLEMARLQSGSLRLQREWQPLEEVIGVALQARAAMLSDHVVRVRIPADLPLLEFDTLLMERALCNLLENAARYTPAGSEVEIAARAVEGWMEISISDDGPGLPLGSEERLFEKFTRGPGEGSSGGMGLGLAIVRAVMDAHHGTVRAERSAAGGARMVLRLPAGSPPAMPGEEA